MPRKKGKHSTPAELDFLFDRDIISEDDYGDFWKKWWRSSKKEREDIANSYIIQESKDEPQLPLKGVITKRRVDAESLAKTIGGYVVRRDSKGRFSSRGRHYQAIKRGTTKKQKSPFRGSKKEKKKSKKH